MRLGISTSLNEPNPKRWADRMCEMGLKSVVFPVDSNAPEEVIDGFCNEAKAHDLLIAEVGIWRNAISPNETERVKNLEYSINQLKLADRVGAKCCVNVAGSTGAVWDGGYRENFSRETFDKTVKMVQTVIDEASPQNTFFTLEPMPWMFPSGPDEYLELIEAVNRERFAVHMDIINITSTPKRYFFHNEFLDEVFDKLGDRIKSCHLKDTKLLPGYTFQLKECACGEGDFNIEHYVELIDRIDPEMPLIIEHLGSDEEYAESTKYVMSRLGIQQ